jgi:error-prone DNA polymerase
MTLEESEPLRRGNASSVLCSPAGMAARFAEHPAAVAETLELADRLHFDLTAELGYRYPGSDNPDADRQLATICTDLLAERYAGSPDRREAEGRLDQELGTIRHLGLSGFFLLHRDILELAREVAVEVRGPDSARSILPPGCGRGSSVSSVVCYLTGLSHIDPVKAGLFAGRFLNDEVAAVPDIDIDFPRDIREVLIPRVVERYGREHAALVAAFPTYRPKGVVRDLGKALGLPPAEIERVAKLAGFHGEADELEALVGAAIGKERAASSRWRSLVSLATEAMGLPRHASQHSGGMVISTRPLIDVCPVVPAAMEGRQIVQWDKDSCADAGFLKIDLLGLGMLSAIERTVVEIERVRGERIDLSRIPLDDPETFESIRAAETTGVFQIESRAQMQMLPRTLPQDLDDLTVQVALVRPGPIQGGAVHPYIERRKRLREDPNYQVPYEHPLLEPVLKETLGTIIFQEQVIEVAMAMAGFSAAEAEGLRRAMSRKRSAEALQPYHERFITGAFERNDVWPEVGERSWTQMRGFSGFGFPKSHAAAFAQHVYRSAWLRIHYGPEFLCSLLNEQPMGFYPPDSLVHEAQRRGVRVARPDAGRSSLLCRVERVSGGLTVRIGLAYVKGVKQEEMEALVAERQRGGIFEGIADLAARSGASRDGLERLAWAGALDELPLGAGEAGERRRVDSWRLGIAGTAAAKQLALPLEPPPAPELDPLSRWQKVVEDYRSTGVNLGEHPLELLRGELGEGVARSPELKRIDDGATVEVAGMVVARQRPETAKGITFMLLEDERGTINLIVGADVYERSRTVVRSAPLVRARGRLERRDGAVNVIVFAIDALESKREAAAAARRIEPSSAEPQKRKTVAELSFAERRRARELAIAELRAVAPSGHSFGRR